MRQVRHVIVRRRIPLAIGMVNNVGLMLVYLPKQAFAQTVDFP